MAEAQYYAGTVMAGFPVLLMGHVRNWEGDDILQADVASISYTVFELSSTDHVTRSPVTGHENIAVVVAEAVYDTLQTKSIWTKDATGFNFAHSVKKIGDDEPFPDADTYYYVLFKIVPLVGPPIPLGFKLQSI